MLQRAVLPAFQSAPRTDLRDPATRLPRQPARARRPGRNLVGGIAWERSKAARDARGWSDHTQKVISTLKDLGLAIWVAETGQRGYLLTGV
ncbi:CHASE3 domain-containing protein [Roseomonas sp. SG15]|uniref:CHASE3 domain-containing protein n=1 Tax=Roseomonas indoligenes TaxID=2820811 RepID=A0A940N218_9PROT|nr:CHASE3 domain-containing protein [Pararoseomonas indoligenes]